MARQPRRSSCLRCRADRFSPINNSDAAGSQQTARASPGAGASTLWMYPVVASSSDWAIHAVRERWHIANIFAVLNVQYVPVHLPLVLNIKLAEVDYTNTGAASVCDSRWTRTPR
ncbi:hypothetical protein C8R45DRAFT_944271 [Mycena sanguinolenta]|nr:hypothetical protein C8R45DRAFT_944271 [Mycena sanguinolenta]